MKRLCRSHLWTETSLNFCSTNFTLHRQRIPPRGFVLNFKYERNIIRPKRFSRTRHCILTWTRRHYICHRLLLHKVPIIWNNRHVTLRAWSGLSATCRIVGNIVSLHESSIIRGNPTLSLPLTIILKLVVEIPPHVTSSESTVTCHCLYYSSTEPCADVAICAVEW